MSPQVEVLQSTKESDWEDLLFYSRRVRTITMDWSPHLMSAFDAQRLVDYALILQQEEGPLFPNLHSLEACVRNAVSARILVLLAGPRLSHVMLDCYKPELLIQHPDFVAAFFSNLRPPALKRLEFISFGGALNLSHLLQPFKALEELAIRGLRFKPFDLVTCLSGAKSLRKIFLRSSISTVAADLVAPTVSNPDDLFSGLEEANVDSPSLPAVLSPSSIPLQLRVLCLNIHLPRGRIHEVMRDSILLIGKTCTLIRKLKIMVSPRTDDMIGPVSAANQEPPPRIPIGLSILPLLQLHDLEELHVYDTTRSMLPKWTEEDLPSLVTSWPRLTSLSWESVGTARTDDLSVLSRFASFPALRILVIPLDATVGVSNDVLLPFEGTVCLGVGEWTINVQSIEHIAESITELHPYGNGRLQLYGHNKSEERRPWWEAVQKKMRKAIPVGGKRRT